MSLRNSHSIVVVIIFLVCIV
jgi:hypothetical protein